MNLKKYLFTVMLLSICGASYIKCDILKDYITQLNVQKVEKNLKDKAISSERKDELVSSLRQTLTEEEWQTVYGLTLVGKTPEKPSTALAALNVPLTNLLKPIPGFMLLGMGTYMSQEILRFTPAGRYISMFGVLGIILAREGYYTLKDCLAALRTIAKEKKSQKNIYNGYHIYQLIRQANRTTLEVNKSNLEA